MKQTSSTDRKLWAGIIITTILILLMAPLGRPAQRFFEAHLGKNIFIVFTLTIALAGVYIFYRYVVQAQSGRARRLLKFLLVAGFYTWRIVTLNVHVERFHLIEYGLLSALVYLLSERHKQGWASLGWGFAASWLVGIMDETYQWWLPTRVGEWRDVVLNMQSGALGLGALLLLINRKIDLSRPPRRSLATLLLSFSLLSALSGAFILKIHVFGYRHFDSEIGSFNSMFTTETLLETSKKTYLETVERAGGHQTFEKITDVYLFFYEREAKEHFDRAHLLIELQRVPEAVSEYLITQRYYRPWMDGTGTWFSPETKALLQKTNPLDPSEFRSPVYDWILVSVTRSQVQCITLAFFLLFLISATIIFFRLL